MFYDNSFERFMGKPDGQPLVVTGLNIRVLWFEQKARHNSFLADRSTERLKRVFSLFGNQENIGSLKVAKDSAVPFVGEWFSKIKFGRNVTLGAETVFLSGGGISLGDGVIVGEKACLITGSHPTHPTQIPHIQPSAT